MVGKKTNEMDAKMTFNLPYKVRAALYVFTGLASPVVTYLLAKGVIGELEMALWAAEVTAVSALAAANVISK